MKNPDTITSDELTRPIIGIENRTPQEVFDIMADRFRARLSADKARMDDLRKALKVAEMAFTDICQFTPSGPTDNFEQIAKHARATTLEAVPLIRIALQNASTTP